MANVSSKLVTLNGDTVVLKEDSLPAASPLSKGVVKQGDSEICVSEQNSKYEYQNGQFFPDFNKKYNDGIKSRREAGQISNTKYVLILDFNGENVDYEEASDNSVYQAGDTATLHMSGKYIPEREGYEFLGWALTADASVPTYAYNESDPQDYTLTFTNNDITLYAVWGEPSVNQYTLTYSLGEYGTGKIPSSQIYDEGDTVYVDFDDTPTVNDGSGRVFVGWTTTDGNQSYMMATYKQGGVDSFSIYSDVTLYPVFCEEFSLDYSAGNDGTGSVPQGGTYYNGQTAYISFSPAPTCVSDPSKSFLGWATTDDAQSPTYTPGSIMNFIQMVTDVTLYAVFGAASANTVTLTYALGDYAMGSVPAAQTETKNMMGMAMFQISFSPKPTCTRAGDWTFLGWSTTDGSSSAPYMEGMITTGTFSTDTTLYPVFYEVVHSGMYVDNNLDDIVEVQYFDEKADDWISAFTAYGGMTTRFENFSIGTNYRIVAVSSSSILASFDGDYNNVNYKDQSLTVQGGVIYDPTGAQYWNYSDAPDGTLYVIND